MPYVLLTDAHIHLTKGCNLNIGCKGFNRHQGVALIVFLPVHSFVKWSVYKLLKPSNLYKLYINKH